MNLQQTILLVIVIIVGVISLNFLLISVFKPEEIDRLILKYKFWKIVRRDKKAIKTIWDHARWKNKTSQERDSYVKKYFKYSDEEWNTFSKDFCNSFNKIIERVEKEAHDSLNEENVTSLENYKKIKELEKLRNNKRKI